jgi:hypothetical protein
MKMRLIFMLFLIVPLHVYPQDYITLSAMVLDSTSGQPLPSASVALQHTSLGTITNELGRFTLYIRSAQADNMLVVSMLGYKKSEVPIKNFPGVIRLTVSTTVLPVIVVQDLSVKEILKRVHKNLTRNYTTDAYQLEGFYREIQKADEQYVSLMEAVSRVHSEGFDKGSNEKYGLIQLRKSIGYQNPYVPFWDNSNLLAAFLGQNFIKYKKRMLLKYKEAKMLDETSIDGIPVYVVELSDRSDFWPTSLYIRSDNFAIIRYEENYNRTTDAERSWVVQNNPLARSYPQSKALRINFKYYGEKYFPENYEMAFRAIYKDIVTGKQLMDFEITQRFLVTKIITGTRDVLPEEKLIDPKISLKLISQDYDPAFWRNYTIIEETPLDSLIRQDLEQQMKLEDQFKKK